MVTINPARVALTLALIVAGLSLGHVSSQCMKYLYGHEVQLGFERLLNLDGEGNIPSWYSAVALFVSGCLLAGIGVVKRAQRAPFATHWMVLAGIFVYLSLDEASAIHGMGAILLRRFHFTGYLYSSWVLLGGVFALTVGLSYVRFLFHLPAASRNLFLLAASLYIGGAIGIEMIGGNWTFLYGVDNLTYYMLVAVEETLEMTGIVVFIYALCAYIEQDSQEIRIRFRSAAPSRTADSHSSRLLQSKPERVRKAGDA